MLIKCNKFRQIPATKITMRYVVCLVCVKGVIIIIIIIIIVIVHTNADVERGSK